LQELNKKFRFLKPGTTVLDLGSFAGGWLQVACEVVGPKGRVLGVDLRALEKFSPADIKGSFKPPLLPEVFIGDVTEEQTRAELRMRAQGRLDVVLSDMSPHISGIKDRDIAGSLELVEIAFATAQELLKEGGWLIAKIFPSPDSELLFKRMNPWFVKLQRVCLDSSRKTSNEYYFVGKGFRSIVES